jgi:hypothetical protein
MRDQFSRRYSGKSVTVIPSIPAAPALAFTRLSASFKFSFSQTSSISLSVFAWLSVPSPAVVLSTLPSDALGASPLPSSSKASSCWIFCRFLTPSRSPYSPPCRSGLQVNDPTMPFADFWQALRDPHESLSPILGTPARPPGVSSTAFSAQPPDLQPEPLMDMGLSVICPLARLGMPIIRFLSVGSRLCSTLLSDTLSRDRCPCASLCLHLHQVGKGIFTPKLSNMPSTQKKPRLRRGSHGENKRLEAELGSDSPDPNVASVASLGDDGPVVGEVPSHTIERCKPESDAAGVAQIGVANRRAGNP